MRRGYSGVSKLRRTLKRMEPNAQRRITDKLKDAGAAVHRDAVSFVIGQGLVDTHGLLDSMSWKLGRDKSSVLVGPSADKAAWQKIPFTGTMYQEAKLSRGQKDARWNYIKGYWGEFGTEGESPQPSRPFMEPAWMENQDRIRRNMREAMNKALAETVAGG